MSDLSTLDHPALALLPATPTESQMEAFGRLLQKIETSEGPDIATQNHVNSDLYGRSITIGKDTFLVGLPHKRAGLAICVGDITVWTAQGRERLTGAHILNTKPGGMRIGFAHSETTWFTVHANKTNGTDVEMIEDSLVEHPERLQTRRTQPERIAA